jgi:hypothetical protein
MHLEQGNQLRPDERRRFDVIGGATQSANCAAEISGDPSGHHIRFFFCFSRESLNHTVELNGSA